MLWTLQWYILREMGKTFLLTAIGLTALLGLGGGVLNMIELEQVTALNLFRILSLVFPLAAAIALPIAALYSATVSYGRLSADNELIACRASGINIHHLLLPAVVISLVSATATFFCLSYFMPGVIRNLDRLVRANLDQIVQQTLASPQRLPLVEERYRVYADEAEVARGPSTTTDGGDDEPNRVVLHRVAFVEMDKGNWIRYGTARRVDIQFDLAERHRRAAADMWGLSVFDRRRGQWFEEEHDAIAPYDIPQRIPMRIKWMDLGELLWYRRRPEKLPAIQEGLTSLRGGIARALFYASVLEAWRDTQGQHVELGDGSVSLVMSSGNVRADQEDGRPFFEDGVTVREEAESRVRTLTAPEATLMVERGAGGASGEVVLRLTGNVEITDRTVPGNLIRKPDEPCAAFALPVSAVEEAAHHTERQLLDPDADLNLGTWVAGHQSKLVEELGKSRRKIAKELHSRLAFSTTTLVLVILGAGLGIAFRGSHALTAFGISAVPTVFSIAIIIAGRQMAEKPGTAVLGLVVLWGSIVVVGLVDVIVLTRLVRR